MNLPFFLFLLITFKCTVPVMSLRKRDLHVRNQCRQLHLELLISPIVDKKDVRRIEVQWEYAPHRKDDWIGLFTQDPLIIRTGANLPDILWKMNVLEEHGWANTSILENHVEPESLGFQAHCLNYYAAYFTSDNQILRATCLRTEPTWMWDLKNDIGLRRLRHIFIPGTHDSAAYGEYDEDKGDTRVRKYSITQDESVLGQLIYGVRYIDLRVGYYESNREKWWGNHGVAKIHPLRIIFRDIITFLNNTNEIVLLDIQEFPVGFGKTKDIHKLLVAFLKEELGAFATPAYLSYYSSPNEVWRTGKRLIIGYDDRQIVAEEHNFLWPPVLQKWGNVQTLPRLYNYLAGVLEMPPTTAWAAMAQLTPKTWDVVLDSFKGLRRAAENTNHNITFWFRNQDWSRRANVVAVDFLRSTGVVRAAIEWNKFQGVCRA